MFAICSGESWPYRGLEMSNGLAKGQPHQAETEPDQGQSQTSR